MGSISHLHDEQCQTTAKTTHSPSEHKAQVLTNICTKLPTRQGHFLTFSYHYVLSLSLK